MSVLDQLRAGFTQLDRANWISICSATIALAGATVAALINLRGQRRQYFAELRKWADEALNLLSEADHACLLDPTRMPGGGFYNLRHSLSLRLSAQIDKGRWFFPNLKHGSDGSAAAFEGNRQPALNFLASSYRLIRKMDYVNPGNNDKIRISLIAARKCFVDEIQGYLDPKLRPQRFRQLMGVKGSLSTPEGSSSD